MTDGESEPDPKLADDAARATIRGLRISRRSLAWTIAAVIIAGIAIVVPLVATSTQSTTGGSSVSIDGDSDNNYVNMHGEDNRATIEGSSGVVIQNGGSQAEFDRARVQAVLKNCPTQTDCSNMIIGASAAAWPQIAEIQGCTVEDRAVATERYYVGCTVDDTQYFVFWRNPNEPGTPIVDALRSQMTQPYKASTFTVQPTTEVLGNYAYGLITTPQATSYTCAWEYFKFPIAVALQSANEAAARRVCEQAALLDSSGIGALFVDA